MNHDMSRYALENGPDEPRYVQCPTCNGQGGTAYDGPCTDCLGEGEIPAEDEQR